MEASDVKYWRVQILNTIILIRSPWGWVGEGIGLNAKSTPRQFQKMQNCRLILTWQLRPEPSSGRRPWRWPRCPPWSPPPSGRSSGWPLRRASPTFPWSFQSWRLDLDLSSDPGSVQMENASQNKNFTFHSCPFACSRVLCFWSDDVNWCDEKLSKFFTWGT